MKAISIFYLLITYIIFQFAWWAYLLFDLNQDIYYLNQQMARESQVLLEKNLHKKWLMIAGEGIVFLIILCLGIIKTHKTYKREIQLNQQQKNFLLSITHEFKSPLASIKLYLQTFLKHELDKEKKETFIKNSLSDVERLDKLVENALFAAQMEDRKLIFIKKSLNISALIQQIIQNHAAKNRIKVNIKPDLSIPTDETFFSSLLLNIIENALKYSPELSPIEVSLKRDKNKVIMAVSDEGPGIAKEEQAKVFEKFYRIGNESTRKTRGTGLGLYIAKNIMKLHKGKISIKENYPRGTLVEMSFPEQK